MADKELNSSDVGRLLDAGMPGVKMAKMLGRSKVSEAKNKLDVLRAEDPATYDKKMRETTVDRVVDEDFVKDIYRDINKKAWDKVRGLKKGGTVSASSRADGIAQRGKTRGRMV
jgi:hypothetical protein